MLIAMSSVLAAVLAAILIVAASAHAALGWDECTEMWVRQGWHPGEMQHSVRVCRDGYIAFSYDSAMGAPAFSAYYVTPERMRRPGINRTAFYDDPDLEAKGVVQHSAYPEAVWRSYDRGHLAPDQMMDWSYASRDASYSAANIAPQGAKFNRDPWRELEQLIGQYVSFSDTPLHIITGVAYDNRKTPNVIAGVTIPDYYFTVICDPLHRKSAGFIGRNENIVSYDSHEFRTVRDVEAVYGGPLFPRHLCHTTRVDPTKWWHQEDDVWF